MRALVHLAEQHGLPLSTEGSLPQFFEIARNHEQVMSWTDAYRDKVFFGVYLEVQSMSAGHMTPEQIMKIYDDWGKNVLGNSGGTVAIAPMMGTVAELADMIVNLVRNGMIFFAEIWRGFEENVDEQSALSIAATFIETGLMVLVSPGSYLIGVVEGVAAEVEQLADFVVEIGGLPGLKDIVLEFGRFLFLPEGEILMKALGYEVGVGFADDFNRLMSTDLFALAHELGVITGPLLIEILVGIFTGGAAAGLMKLARSSPKLAKILKKLGHLDEDHGGGKGKGGDADSTQRKKEKDEGTEEGGGEAEKKKDSERDKDSAEKAAKQVWKKLERASSNRLLSWKEFKGYFDDAVRVDGVAFDVEPVIDVAKSTWQVKASHGTVSRAYRKKGWIAREKKGEQNQHKLLYAAENQRPRHIDVIDSIDKAVEAKGRKLDSAYVVPEAIHAHLQELLASEEKAANDSKLLENIRLTIFEDVEFEQARKGSRLDYAYSIAPNPFENEAGHEIDVKVTERNTEERVQFARNLERFQGEFQIQDWKTVFFGDVHEPDLEAPRLNKNLKERARVDLVGAVKLKLVTEEKRGGEKFLRLRALDWPELKELIQQKFQEDSWTHPLFKDGSGQLIVFGWESLGEFCRQHSLLPNNVEYEKGTPYHKHQARMREVLWTLKKQGHLREMKKNREYILPSMPAKRYLPKEWWVQNHRTDTVRNKYFLNGSGFSGLKTTIAEEGRDEVMRVVSLIRSAKDKKARLDAEDAWALLFQKSLVSEKHRRFPDGDSAALAEYAQEGNYHADHKKPLAYLWSHEEYNNVNWDARKQMGGTRKNLKPMWGPENQSKGSEYYLEDGTKVVGSFAKVWWVGPDFVGPYHSDSVWDADETGLVQFSVKPTSSGS